MDQFGNIGTNSKMSLDKLEQIIQENKEQLETGVREHYDGEG